MKYYSMKCFTFLDIENNGFILNTCHDTANRRKQWWVFPLFSPDSDDRLSLNFHRFVILFLSCDTLSVELWTILFTDVVRLL